MRKLFIVFCILVFSSYSNLFSQVSIHFSAGINNSNIALNERSDIPFGSITDPIGGYFVGAGAGYKLTEKINLSFSTQLSQKGFAYNERSQDRSATRFSYIDFIPELEIRFLKIFDLGLGVNFAYKIIEASWLTEQEAWTNATLPFAKDTDFGIVAKLKMNINNFYLFTRINRGAKSLADITFTDVNGQELNTTRTFNKNLQIGIGYRFSFEVN